MPVVAYLFYVTQIGITMPLLNESLRRTKMKDSPFMKFFKRGMCVSLCTENPLHVHYTEEPIMEEYATSSQMWRLSVSDLCEIARNSVVQSGFREEEKKEWLGEGYAADDMSRHDITKTNVPTVRMRFRKESLLDELKFLRQTETPDIKFL